MRVFIRPRGGEYVSIGFHPVCTLRGFGCLSNTAHWATPDLDFRDNRNAIIGHGPRNSIGRAYSLLGLLRLRLGIRPFRTSPWRLYRRDEAEFCSEAGQGIHVSRLHQAIKNPSSRRQTPKET